MKLPLIILITLLTLYSCRPYATPDCDFNIPPEYRLVKNNLNEYSIANDEGYILAYWIRGGIWSFDSPEDNQLIIYPDSCKVKGYLKKYLDETRFK